MPLFDKVKAQAAQLAQKAQEAGKAGQAKLEDVQARRRADAALRDLGAAVYAERTSGATPDTRADIERLLTELSKLDADVGLFTGPAADFEEGVPPSEPEPVPPGGFTLES